MYSSVENSLTKQSKTWITFSQTNNNEQQQNRFECLHFVFYRYDGIYTYMYTLCDYKIWNEKWKNP